MHALHPIPRPCVSLRVTSLTKVFGETIALWDVDFDCRSTELITVQGTNGSGKSTLLRIIAGVVAPTRGRVAWTTDSPAARSRIGLLGHATHLFDELSAIENVELAATLAHRDVHVAADLLGRLGVGEHAGRRVGNLSAGTRRRVGLARMLATDPDVLLVDEPFAGLDSAAADRVAGALADARDDGRLIIIATHDDERSRSITTRTVRLDEGRVRRATGPAAAGSAAAGSAAAGSAAG